MEQRTLFKKYPSQVTTASIVHSEYRGDVTLIVTKEDVNNQRPKTIFVQKLEKWNMKDIRSSASNRPLPLSDDEHKLFVAALKTKGGQDAITELKNKKVNVETDKVIDYVSKNILKSKNLKEVFNLLKTEEITEFSTKSTRSLAITTRDMYDFLVQKEIIKITQTVNV